MRVPVVKPEPGFFVSLICLVLTSVYPSPCYGGKLEVGDGFFYNSQYEKAVTAYTEALSESTYDARTKTNIKYKIGLSYYLLRIYDKSMQFWTEARKENPGIFNGKIYRVPSAGMEPELVVGDHIVVDNEYYKHKTIQRWDVAVFLSPSDSKSLLIKRVVGLPGDKLEIKKKEIFINGTRLFDPKANFEDNAFVPKRDNFGPLVIPERSYFLLGDNRDRSFDSRFAGPVVEDLIVGKALVIYGSLPNKDTLEGVVADRAGKIIK